MVLISFPNSLQIEFVPVGNCLYRALTSVRVIRDTKNARTKILILIADL
jgi:hypothetical protein